MSMVSFFYGPIFHYAIMKKDKFARRWFYCFSAAGSVWFLKQGWNMGDENVQRIFFGACFPCPKPADRCRIVLPGDDIDDY